MDEIWERLKMVYDPELGVNVVDLGLIYELTFEESVVTVVMTLTTPGCPMHDTIVGGVRRALEELPQVTRCAASVVWEPAWTPERMSDEAKEQLAYF